MTHPLVRTAPQSGRAAVGMVLAYLRGMGIEGWRPQAGQIIDGTYRVLRTLGAGGMGVVVLAQDIALDR